MEKLRKDWITEGLVDFEYKKYILLAYLKQVKQKFRSHKLYPALGDLIAHYENLMSFKENKTLLHKQFPGEAKAIDLKKLQILYKKVLSDDQVMKEIEAVTAYALPRIQKTIEEGKDIYDFVEDHLIFDTVGMLPIYDKEGYLFLSEDGEQQVKVFRYEVSIFENAKENYRSLSTTFINNEIKSLARSVEQIKLDLIKRFKELPNPATFLITSTLPFPTAETLLPVAKRVLIRNIR